MKTTVMKVTVNNEALAKTLGVKPGGTVDATCKNGVPVNREWRNRLKDAKIDKCVTIGKSKAKSTTGGDK